MKKIWSYHSQGFDREQPQTNMQQEPNFQKSSLFSQFFWKKPTRCMVMMPIKPSTKIWKFIISGSGFQALGCRQIRLYRRNLLFLQQEQINWIYCNDVLEALYQIFENIDQGQGPGPWVEPILPQWNYLK